MIRVIIESPYAGDVEGNVAYARAAMRDALDRGEAPYASHLLYPQVYDDSDPKERDRGIQAGYEWMQAADLVTFYIDRGWSRGMLQALRMARVLLKKIQTRSIDTSVVVNHNQQTLGNLLTRVSNAVEKGERIRDA